jgi:hypothetical protein
MATGSFSVQQPETSTPDLKIGEGSATDQHAEGLIPEWNLPELRRSLLNHIDGPILLAAWVWLQATDIAGHPSIRIIRRLNPLNFTLIQKIYE